MLFSMFSHGFEKNKIQYADDDYEPVRLLFRLRIPSLVIGLLLGLILSFSTSRFEDVLITDVSVAFFIPFVVYLASAVGTQTQSIYARDLKTGKAKFKKYLLKEGALGLLFGTLFAAVIAPVVFLWLKSAPLAVSVALSTFGATAAAPVIALIVTEMLQLEHRDPAVGAGPIATVIQDTVSIVIYGLIASAILL